MTGMANGEWRMANGQWRMANGEWQMAGKRPDDRPRSRWPFAIRHSPFDERGFTFVELLVVATLMLILASAVMPLARVSVQREKEATLRRELREMRTAIDKFKDAADAGIVAATELKAGAENYPPDLETLVDGVAVNNDQSGRKLKFLRKIPIDPMTNSTDWGLRAYQDKPDSTSWAGGNVYDVYTKSDGKALDGTKYKDW